MDQILARLNECFSLLTRGSRAAPPRQQTLCATIDWSYRLLTEAEAIQVERVQRATMSLAQAIPYALETAP